jgi:hypothetical protein
MASDRNNIRPGRLDILGMVPSKSSDQYIFYDSKTF